MAKRKSFVINAAKFFDGHTIQENKSIVVEDRKIAEIGPLSQKADFEGWVTPAFIDAHSHIAMAREGEPSEEDETNDTFTQISPLNEPLNSAYFDDTALSDSVDFGVLYACIVPGSGNLLGGRATVIRTFAGNRTEAFFADYGYKMALGFNPRSTTEWRGSRPSTRMGVYALLEKKLDDVRRKREKVSVVRERKLIETERKYRESKTNEGEAAEKTLIEREHTLDFDAEEEALLELLNGAKRAKVHVHKADDVLYLISLVRKFGLKVTADHVMDVYQPEIFNALADAEIPVVYGPLGSFGYKVELKHSSYKNAAALMKSRATFGVMSDHPVTLSMNLRDQLQYFLMHGMPEEQALALVTSRNAQILGIDDRVGTLEPGSFASLLVWNKDPLMLGAKPAVVMGEGRVLRGQQERAKTS